MKLEQNVDNIAIIQEIIVYLISLQQALLVSSCYRIINEKIGCDILKLRVGKSNNKRLLYLVVPFALGYMGLPQIWTFIYFVCLLFSSMNCLVNTYTEY